MQRSIRFLFYHGYIDMYASVSKQSWFLLFLTLVNSLVLAIAFFLSIYFKYVLSLSVMQIGWLLSFYGVGMACGGFLGGLLSDRYQPLWVVIGSSIGQSMVFGLLGFTTDIPILAFLLFAFGVFAYMFKTANQYLLLFVAHQNAHQQRNLVNLSHVASNVGLTLSGVLIGLTTPLAFCHLFLLLSGLLFGVAAYLSLSFDHLRVSQQESQVITDKSISVSSASRGVLYLLLTMVLLVGFLISQLGTTYPIYIMQQFPSLGQRGVSILFMLDTVLIIFFQAALVRLTKAWSPFFILGMGGFCMGLGMGCLSIVNTFYGAMMLGICWTVGEMLFIPSMQLQCVTYGAQHKKGLSLGCFQSMFALSAMIGPLLGGALYAVDQGISLWRLSGMVGCLLCGLCLYLQCDRQ